MHKEADEGLRVRLKLVVLEFADHLGVTKACREFNVPRSRFYRWKQKYEKAGQAGLYRERPVAYRHPRRTSAEVVEKILKIRGEHQLGAFRIMYYLNCYHAIKISESTLCSILNPHRINRSPRTVPGQALYTPNGIPKRFPATTCGSM